MIPRTVPGQVQVDDVDRAILELLREDARRTLTDIAQRVNLSAAPVKRRIDRLERSGVIAGYTVEIDHTRLGPSVEAFTELRFTGTTDVEEIVAAAARLPEVHEVYTTAGDPDALVHVRVDGVEHLQRVINQLRHSGSVIGTKTLMVLGTWKRPS
ncbi:MAG: transcription regulator AsnC [Conexibacter sp.]|jgi:DNA-binding Lrp family transcriptional regulator|nr:transcription regulator AsnC [Conexibacter sp.]